MSGRTLAPPPARAPWVAAYATGCAEAVATGLGLLATDEVTTDAAPDDSFVLEVIANPPRTVRAVRWSAESGWWYSPDPVWRGTPRWSPLPVEPDADPLTLAEAVAGTG